MPTIRQVRLPVHESLRIAKTRNAYWQRLTLENCVWRKDEPESEHSNIVIWRLCIGCGMALSRKRI